VGGVKMKSETFTVCPDYQGECFEVDGYILFDIDEYMKIRNSLEGICVEFIDEIGDNYVIINISCDERQRFFDNKDNIFIKIYDKPHQIKNFLFSD
jgi:hypothetical protein